MGILDFVKKGAQELFIARPDGEKGNLVYKWPDPTIPWKSQLTVYQDEVALFFRQGQFVGELGPGRHTLDTQNIPFLSSLVDSVTGGNIFQAEVWFVTKREMGGVTFGGRLGEVDDPRSGLTVGTMVHGEFSLQVDKAEKLIAFFGTKSWSRDEEFIGWFKNQFLKVIRDRLAEMLVKQNLPITALTSGAMTEEVEAVVVEGTKPHLERYGIRVVSVGNFVVAIDEDDQNRLEAFRQDEAQINLASRGNMQAYQQFAAAKAMMGAGEGMSKGGGGGGGPMLDGAGLGVGMGMAAMFQKQQQGGQAPSPPAPPTTAPAAGTATCPKCGAVGAAGKFCGDCGTPLAAAEKKAFCGDCGKPMTPGKKFCGECGAAQT
ncbi:MAG TPA: SPFH domain-containing protein [Polyangia bacterium]|nr:SPFH domain-containing protein [Polyangia bacterium]